VWRTRRAGAPIVLAYPTRSTVSSPRATVTLALAALLGRGRLRWHLHEYAIFGGRRALLDLLLAIGGGRVVVSTASEADALRVARRVDVHVLPPANGTPLDPLGTTPADPPIIGLFGIARSDKGLGAFNRCLAPGERIAVETVGEGWDEVAWPEGVEPVHHGRVATAELAAVMGRWTLAIAPFVEGATDGRMSLRTPLTCGVPTLTTVTRPADLTLRPPHLLLDPDTALDEARTADRLGGAAEVARFEADTVKRLADVLWGPP
jgi:hypothetical protein